MLSFDDCLWAARFIRGILNPVVKDAAPSTSCDGRPVAETSGRARDRVVSFYQDRFERLEMDRSQTTLRRARYLRYAVASCFALAVLLALSLGIRYLPVWSAALPVVPAIVSLDRARKCKRRSRDLASVLDMCQRRLERVRHEWMGKGDSGSDLEVSDHLSSRDLDLFGEGSMFELLCDVDTPAGRETLARWLQSPAEAEELISRQQSIRCLRDRTDLREQLARLREGEASEYSWSKLREWLLAEPAKLPGWAPWAALCLSLAMIAVSVCWWAGVFQTTSGIWEFAAVAALEAVLALFLRRRIQSILADLNLPARKVESLRQLCALVRGERLESSRLVELQSELEGSPERIGSLQRLARLLDLRHNMWTVWPYLLLLGTTQTTIRIERWRLRHGRQLSEWINALGEFEALMAIAAYAYENPDDPFPELADDGPLFEAVALGHPLMDAQKCVRNDVALSEETRFLLVTGSNMSGKSTLLRAVGLNATLAWMGAPVRAERLRLSKIQVCASIRIEDSLLGGASRFYAEVQRLKAMLDRGKSGPPVLFLIDELFGGTNSADRRIAAEALIRSFVQHQSIGLITSHDLALSEIAERPELKGTNVHFIDLATADGQMTFDYRIHRGKLDHGNALKIIRLVGILPE
jgi:hypothetical protein